MLQDQVTLDDVLFITIMITFIVGWYMSYRAGRYDQWAEDRREIRLINREIRRRYN